MALDSGSDLAAKHLTAREFVLKGIREAMLSGRLVAGQELDDHSLAEDFGVSRTPVREALKVLEVQGFVSHHPFSKPVVAAVSPERIDEVFLMRIALESAAAARACLSIQEPELKYLERCAKVGREALAKQDAVKWSKWNREFHTKLAGAAGMPLLSREIDSLIDLSSFYSTMSWSQIPDAFAEAQLEHLHVVQACRKRDPELVQRLMQAHLAASCAVQMKLVREREAVRSTQAPDAGTPDHPPRRKVTRSRHAIRV